MTILDEMENWSRVRTEDGYLGYIKNNTLKDRTEEQPVSRFEEPVYTNISLDEPICLVWHQVTTRDANKTMEKLMANTKGVNVIAPTWFLLTDNQGNSDFTDSSLIYNVGSEQEMYRRYFKAMGVSHEIIDECVSVPYDISTEDNIARLAEIIN